MIKDEADAPLNLEAAEERDAIREDGARCRGRGGGGGGGVGRITA